MIASIAVIIKVLWHKRNYGRRVFCWPLTATHFLLALPCPKQQSIVGTKQSNGRMVIDSHQHGRFGGGGGGLGNGWRCPRSHQVHGEHVVTSPNAC